MNNGKRGLIFSPRWIAWPKSTRPEGRHESELETDRAQTSRSVAPVARTRDRYRRGTGAAPGAAYEAALAGGLSEAEAEARAMRSYDWRLLECELSRAEQTPAARAWRQSR
jgi:hypothetical protein